MSPRPQFDMATLDPSDPASIGALIDFHRTVFGDACMVEPPAGAPDGTPPAAPPAGAPGTPPAGAPAGDGGLGFPPDTPVAEMTTEQKAAYDAHKRELNRQRRQEWTAATGGLSAAEVKAQLDELTELKRQGMTDQEKALDDARKEGRDSGYAEASGKFASGLVAAELKAALAGKEIPAEQIKGMVEFLDHTKFLTPEGEVDADKVKTYAAGVAPNGGTWPDTGGGSRGDQIKKSDRESGLAEAQKRFGPKS